MSIEIKPCPFCGRSAEVEDILSWGMASPAHYVACASLRCRGNGPERKTIRGAIAAWNRRTE